MILLLLAGYWSIRIAGADLEARRASFGGVAQAIRLAAGNADYRVLLADLLEAQGRDSRDLLESAVALNPNDAQVLIRLGLETEMRSDAGGAERYFLEAARVSAQYQPRWTLANYYYRHNNPTAFWYWVRDALAKSYGDRRPIFRLCWNMSADSSTILKNALPEQGAVWRDYLRYLVGEGRLDAAQPVATAILDRLQPSDVRLLVDYDDALLHAGFWQPALTVWNRLCASTLLRHAALTPERGLTNGNFQVASANGGFDWRVPSYHGVSGVQGRNLFRVSFSGKQPERCEVLWQYVLVAPTQSYEVSFEYQTREIGPHTGLHWRVFDANSGADLTLRSPHLSSDDWKSETLSFAGREGTRLARLVLNYERSPGTTRVEGAASIRLIAIRVRP